MPLLFVLSAIESSVDMERTGAGGASRGKASAGAAVASRRKATVAAAKPKSTRAHKRSAKGGTSRLERIDDELFLHICSFLDAAGLARLVSRVSTSRPASVVVAHQLAGCVVPAQSECCETTRALCSEDVLWWLVLTPQSDVSAYRAGAVPWKQRVRAMHSWVRGAARMSGPHRLGFQVKSSVLMFCG